jgi:hypothetical protein
LFSDRNLYSFAVTGGDQRAGSAVVKFSDVPSLLCELVAIKVPYFSFWAPKGQSNATGVVADDRLGSD